MDGDNNILNLITSCFDCNRGIRRFFELDDFEYLKEIFCESKNWTDLRNNLESYYGEEM